MLLFIVWRLKEAISFTYYGVPTHKRKVLSSIHPVTWFLNQPIRPHFPLTGDSSETSKTITDVSGAGVSDSPSATQEKQVAKVGQTVTGDKWAISLLSAKTFTEIKDEYYTDTPEEGKIYLVLFFEVENVSNEDDYFNYFNIESYVDGYNLSLIHI